MNHRDSYKVNTCTQITILHGVDVKSKKIRPSLAQFLPDVGVCRGRSRRRTSVSHLPSRNQSQ